MMSLLSCCTRLWWLGAGALLVAATGGCASHRPAPVVVELRARWAPTDEFDRKAGLKLVTYNIWGLPAWMTGAEPGRYARINRELEKLDADIILIQEAWTAKARKAAPDNGPWSIARARGQHTFFQQNGLVTLSKFPIVGGVFYPFSKAAFPDRLVNKGALKVTVQLSDGRLLNVWNVHLQQGGPPEVQESQVRELVSHVQQAEDGQIADLVGGDFNCTPGSRLFRELDAALGPSVSQLGGMKPFVTWSRLSAKPGAGETLDYVFVRSRIPFQNIQAVQRKVFASSGHGQRLSDHLGIEAVVKLTPASLAHTSSSAGQEPEFPLLGSGRLRLGGGD